MTWTTLKKGIRHDKKAECQAERSRNIDESRYLKYDKRWSFKTRSESVRPLRRYYMKKDQKTVKTREPITKEALFRRNPVPFGDVRKYYYAACIGTGILLTLCFHISVVAIALRTDTCEQLSNVFIVFLLLFCITTIVGHQLRSFLGYGISALSSLIVLLLLQFYHGTGVMIISNLPEYGEVFRDGAKSTDFWILLAKAIAVIHLLLTIVFINSTIKVKEEPALKGMNVQIQKIKDWMDKNNNSLPAGRRATDYWFVAIIVFCAMTFSASSPEMYRYDYYALVSLVGGCILVACKQTIVGPFFLVISMLFRCVLFQYRFGLIIPVIAAYLGLYVALLYLLLEVEGRNHKGKESGLLCGMSRTVSTWIAVMIAVLLFPVHEFLSVFSGDFMIYQKDVLPLIFFLPILAILMNRVGKWYGYYCCSISYIWLWFAINRSTPYKKNELLYFVSLEQHGSIGEQTTQRLMTLVRFTSRMALVMAGILFVLGTIILFARRGGDGKDKQVVD